MLLPLRQSKCQALGEQIDKHGWIVVGFAALAMSVIACLARWPSPEIHDEFCYLLQADTFRQGRFTNPTHPLWQHFESFHQIVRPTYCAKYPPGYAVFLAVGWQLFGSPVTGLWIAAVAASLAVYWMLRGIVSARWAFVGALALSLHPSLHLPWSQSYMTGWPTVAATALLFGGVLRLRKRLSTVAGVAVACGIIGLVNTRPFEGFVATVAAVAFYFADRVHAYLRFRKCRAHSGRASRSPIPSRNAIVRVAAAGAIPSAIGLGLWCVYNQATTGSMLTMPYSLYERQYAIAPVFLWQSVPANFPDYSHREIYRFNHEYCLSGFRAMQHLPIYLGDLSIRATSWVVMLGMFLAALPILTMKYWIRFRVLRSMALVLFTMIGTSIMVPWWLSHYSATWIPVAIIVATLGLQLWIGRASVPTEKLTTLRRTAKPSQRWLHALCIVLVLQIAVTAVTLYSQVSLPPDSRWSNNRQAIIDKVTGQGDKHLMIVKYSPDHDFNEEWVYNLADIDSSQIVWARSMSQEMDGKLMDYYSDRTVWQVQPDLMDMPIELLREPKEILRP